MSSKLPVKNLGQTATKIPTIGLGTGTGFKFISKERDKELLYVLHKALDLGLRFIDTAEVYFDGHAEELIGKAYKKKRDNVFIATKFLPEHSSYKELLKAHEESLKRLQTDYIDLYQIHWPNPLIPLEETVRALETLVKKGYVKYVGVCNFSLRQLKDIQAISTLPIASLQTEYNLLERSVESDLLPYCKQNKMTLIAYTPLNSGTIVKKEKNSQTLLRLSKKYQKTPSQIILNFLISHPSVIAIPATTNLTHLEENAQSTSFILEKNDKNLLSEAFTSHVAKIDPKKIKVVAVENHAAYSTLAEALANKLNLFPSPKMLSEDMLQGDFLKPVKIRPLADNDKSFEYELINGRIRYWAWVIAFGYDKPIPAIIEK